MQERLLHRARQTEKCLPVPIVPATRSHSHRRCTSFLPQRGFDIVACKSGGFIIRTQGRLASTFHARCAFASSCSGLTRRAWAVESLWMAEEMREDPEHQVLNGSKPHKQRSERDGVSVSEARVGSPGCKTVNSPETESWLGRCWMCDMQSLSNCTVERRPRYLQYL